MTTIDPDAAIWDQIFWTCFVLCSASSILWFYGRHTGKLPARSFWSITGLFFEGLMIAVMFATVSAQLGLL